MSTPTPSPGHSRPSTGHGSAFSSPGTWPARAGAQLARAGSKTASMRSLHRSVLTTDTTAAASLDRRRSMSEVSFPISALVAPHAPSISRSSTYHMRDPRRPPKIQPTEWSLKLKGPDEDGSPIQAWCFFIGFVLFPIWWVASFTPIPKTRRVGGTDTEKAVTLDDPQVEHGMLYVGLSSCSSRSQFPCRRQVMAQSMSCHVFDIVCNLYTLHRPRRHLRHSVTRLSLRSRFPRY